MVPGLCLDCKRRAFPIRCFGPLERPEQNPGQASISAGLPCRARIGHGGLSRLSPDTTRLDLGGSCKTIHNLNKLIHRFPHVLHGYFSQLPDRVPSIYRRISPSRCIKSSTWLRPRCLLEHRPGGPVFKGRGRSSAMFDGRSAPFFSPPFFFGSACVRPLFVA